jgi:hypothetical protein
MDHANWPIGPVGKSTELGEVLPLLAMTYTKFPQACKALMAFMMGADQCANMGRLTRRTLVTNGMAVGAASALTGPALFDWAKAWAQTAP